MRRQQVSTQCRTMTRTAVGLAVSTAADTAWTTQVPDHSVLRSSLDPWAQSIPALVSLPGLPASPTLVVISVKAEVDVNLKVIEATEILGVG